MVIKDFKDLTEMVKKNKKVSRMAVAAAADEHTLEAVMDARKFGVVEPVLVGDAGKIRDILKDMGITDFPEEDIIDAEELDKAAEVAVKLVYDGKADFLMKGMLDTAVLLKAVVNPEYGLGTGRLMSVFKLMEVPGYHKLLSVVDGGMVPYPSLEDKKDIILNSVGALHDLGYERPKVGVLACIEKVNPKMPETVDADQLAKMNQSGEIPDCIVEGPISYDCAMSKEVCDTKGFKSEICGDPDILIGPNIHTANIVSKVMTISMGAKCAAYIVGAKCPIVMSSRGADPEEKYFSILLAVAATMDH